MFFYGRITILKQKIKPFYFDNQNNKAPPAIENKPTKRSWPSLSATMRLNVSRQDFGAIKGITPSKISIRPSAVINVLFIYKLVFNWASFLGKAYLPPPALRIYLKKSDFGSNTITSDLLLKLFL